MAIALAIGVALLVALALLVGFNAALAWRVEKLVPPCGSTITIDGVRLHYLDRGSGPPVLLLHGLASQLQTWTFALTRMLEGRYRLIMPDRPGSGYSQAGPDASLATQADLMIKLLRQLGVTQCLVVGHSAGGALALAMALEHPDDVTGLVLIAPASQPQDDAPDALKGLVVRSRLLRWVFGWTIAAPLAIRHRNKTMAALFGPDPVPAQFATRGGGLLAMRPWTFRNAVRDLEALGDDLPRNARRYGAITQPVEVLFGAGDRILDGALHGQRLADQIAGAEIAFVDAGGHMTPLTSPEPCAAAIDRVTARVKRASASPADEASTRHADRR